MKTRSLRGRLRGLILLVMTCVLLLLGVFSFIRSHNEIDELSDGRLAQSARTLQVLIDHAGLATLQRQDQPPLLVPSTKRPTTPTLTGKAHTYESEVGFQVYDMAGHMLLSTSNLAKLAPPALTDTGYQNVLKGRHMWRLFTQHAGGDRLIIRTGERDDSRQDINKALWIEHGLPLLIGLPLLALLIGWSVQRGLRPLQQLADLLAQRKPDSREPVVLDHPPLELQPVLSALNDQFTQMEYALERERRFSADVAHELRTPISSTMVNLENAEASLDSQNARAAVLSARDSLAQLARKVEQLLALARIEAGVTAGALCPVDLIAVASTVIEELAPLIATSRVDLGVTFVDKHLMVPGHGAALGALLRNLLENALRHVPAGGQVQLTVTRSSHEAVVDVIDDGEGIPPERRAAVFARFHREAGSRGDGYGLGLSIVQRAAQLHHATVELLDSPFGRGLRVRVGFPPTDVPPSTP